MSLTVVKRNRREKGRDFRACVNGCMAGKGDQSLGFREATHFAVICGREVALCDLCASSWQAYWKNAIGVRP